MDELDSDFFFQASYHIVDNYLRLKANIVTRICIGKFKSEYNCNKKKLIQPLWINFIFTLRINLLFSHFPCIHKSKKKVEKTKQSKLDKFILM